MNILFDISLMIPAICAVATIHQLTNLSTTTVSASPAFAPNPSFGKRGIRITHKNNHNHKSKTAFFSSSNKDEYGESFNSGGGGGGGGNFFDDDFNRLARQREAFQFIFGDVEDDMKPDDVHIILFNPNTDREGVHTIEFQGNNMILAFESRFECDQFSACLKKQHFFDPTPQEIKLASLEDYCEQIGVKVQIVPKGLKLVPPKKNVLNLGLNPNLEEEMKMLDYLFQISGDMEDEDVALDSAATTTVVDGTTGAWE